MPRCDSCDLLHLPICSGEADPGHCAPGHPKRHAASKYLSSRMGWPRRKSDAPPKRPDAVRVGFWAPVLMSIGGTETWHRTLLPRLAIDPRIHLVGLSVIDAGACHHEHARAMGCPVTSGPDAVRQLAASVDVLAMWGVAHPQTWLAPQGDPRRPATVAVSHGDGSSDWSRSTLAACSSSVDRYVAVSPPASDPIPPDRQAETVVIPNAVDPARVACERTRDECRKDLGLHPTDSVVLYMGRLSDEKRPLLAIEAARLLPDPFVLVVAGDGPGMSGCIEAAKGHSARVRVVGQKSDVGALLRAADMLVSPSEQEGFGLSVAEAMLAGLPVIGTPVGFLGAESSLARILPVEADAASWADQIAMDWADEGGRLSRAEMARDAIASRYGVETHVEAWASFLWGLGTSRRREAKPRIPLGKPHCVPCSRKKMANGE